AERLRAGLIAEEVDDGPQRRRRRGVERVGPDLPRLDVARPLAAVVVDLEPAAQLAAHLQPVAGRERRLARGGLIGRCGERRGVGDHDGDGDGEREHGYSSPFCGGGSCLPMRLPKTLPAVPGGAITTWILSDSFSASAFWMRSGFLAMSADSRASWS